MPDANHNSEPLSSAEPHSPRQRISSVPGKLLDWVPVWIKLDLRTKGEEFIRVADPQEWDAPILAEDSSSSPSSEKELTLKSYFTPALVRTMMFGWAVFSALLAAQSEFPSFATEHSHIWRFFVAVACSILYLSLSIYNNLQRQFQILYVTTEERRDVLFGLYEKLPRSLLRTRRRSALTTSIAGVFVLAGGFGYSIELVADPVSWTALARGYSVQDLEQRGLVQHYVRNSEGNIEWTISFLALPVPVEQWKCFDMDAARPPTVRWTISFSDDVEGLTTNSNSSWVVAEGGQHKRVILGPDEQPFGSRLDHTKFTTTASSQRLPSPLKLILATDSLEALESLMSRELTIGLSGSLKCAISDGAEMWTWGQEKNAVTLMGSPSQ